MAAKTQKKTRKIASQTGYQLFFGIDGGGTKTRATLLDSDQNLVIEALAGASNPLRVGVDNAVSNICEALDKALDAVNKSRGDIAAGVCGLAGVRREELRHTMRRRLSAELGVKDITVTTDGEVALYGAVNGGAGLVVIAGTGSICCGRNEKGEYATAGGWGPIAGDEGGGSGIARRALQAIAKASDGRGPKTKLSTAAENYFRVQTAEDVATAIYASNMTNQRLAGFAREVIATAQEGDKVAASLISEAGRELGIAANAVIKKLGFANKKFQLSYVGSVFKAGDLIFKPLIETVHSVAPKAFLAAPQLPPAEAAARMAFNSFAK
jgi:N-acetylglucosamine kinase-like BadF-type ATPase